MPKHSNITGIILLGGQSSRMGQNKAFLQFNGESAIERLVHTLEMLFETILLSVNNFNEYSFLGKKMIKDIFPNHGPLSGIHSGLVHSETDKNFFISCDLPFVDIETIEYLIGIKSKTPIVLPVNNSFPQYDCGLYSTEIIPIIEDMIKLRSDENPSIKTLLKTCEATLVDAIYLPTYKPELFYNMNTIENYKFVRDRLENSKTYDSKTESNI